jgi:pimeloyl-ACP methyl ester carboxylesterase
LTSWNCKNLKGDPICFGDYYKMQLRAIEWAKEGSAKLPINFAVGVGVAGHSMGGQATLYSAAQGAESHDIRAAALHHPFTHSFPSIQKVPFLVFTSTNDTVASPDMSHQIFNAAGAYPVRGLVERADDPADPYAHSEPDKWGSNNSGIKLFTVAWFKVHLDKTPKVHGVDFEALVYGKGTDSLCHGGDGPMATCSLLRGAITSDSESKTVIV